MLKANVTLLDEPCDITLDVRQYGMGGRTAIVAMCDEGVYGKVTVNDPEVTLAEGEILVKTWMENEWVPQLLEQLPGNFRDTGRRVRMGYAEAQIWSFIQ